MYYGALPSNGTGGPYPLVVFMHGSTGQWEMYEENMLHYATHGFVVVFPFIKSPEGDKNPLTTNTNGEYIIKGVNMAKAEHSDPKSPLYGLVDVNNVAVAGHSMGATCSIMAGVRLPAGTAKVLITQHPGICGPFGPPPWPATWLKSDLGKANQKLPILFTTATNDGAFWPAPHTAEHELGCFKGGFNGSAAFVQFSQAACTEDHKHSPFTDSGHNCPFKADVETPWVTRMLKLYLQQGGSPQSKCYDAIWGTSIGSLRNSSTVELSSIHPPHAAVTM